jgi:hypothetical protein
MTQAITAFSNIKLIRRCGRVLLGVFLLVVTTNIFPLKLSSPDWGFGLSNNIVNSAFLALVGMCLLRYSARLELQLLAEARTNSQNLLSTTEKPNRSANSKNKALASQAKTRVKQLALVGAISLVLLSVWQAVLFVQGSNAITAKSVSVSNQSDNQIKEVEKKIQGAPDQVIDAEWKKFQATLAPTSFTAELDTEAKRKQLLRGFKAKSQQARLSIDQQVSGATWNLASNTFRVFLMAMTYAWGFYGIHKL